MCTRYNNITDKETLFEAINTAVTEAERLIPNIYQQINEIDRQLNQLIRFKTIACENNWEDAKTLSSTVYKSVKQHSNMIGINPNRIS